MSTDLLSSAVDIAFLTIVRCETANRLSLEGLVVHLLKVVRQECSEQREYSAFFVSNWLVWVRVRQEPSGQREFCAFFVSNWLVCFTFWSTNLLSSAVNFAFFTTVMCKSARRLSWEGLLV